MTETQIKNNFHHSSPLPYTTIRYSFMWIVTLWASEDMTGKREERQREKKREEERESEREEGRERERERERQRKIGRKVKFDRVGEGEKGRVSGERQRERKKEIDRRTFDINLLFLGCN